MNTVAVTDHRPALEWSAVPRLLMAGALSVVCCAAGLRFGVLLAWLFPVVWAAVVDARVVRLPDRVVVVGAVVFTAVLVVTVPIAGSWASVTGALAGAALLAGICVVPHLLSPAGFGFGDVKYGVLVGLGLGLVRPALGIVVFATSALLQLLVAACRPWPAQRVPGADRRAAPFGPALAIAAVGWVTAALISSGGVV